MDIQFLNLHRQYQPIKKEIDQVIKKVLEKQHFILGDELISFEREFANYLGIEYVVGVGSGTDGLILALRALNIGEGDEVITIANSFVATALAITTVGAIPVLVDCNAATYQIDVEQVKKKITKRTKAILPVHLYGAPCEIGVLKKLAKEKKLFLIEDACQAHGATFAGEKVGTFGDLGVYSFYPGKNLGAYGDGGAISTNSKSLYKKLLKLRNYGQVKKYHHEEFGLNSRLDEIQAAILRVKLQYLNTWNEKRNKIADIYKNGIKRYKTQTIIEKGRSCYHLFTIESNHRQELMQYLEKKGIHTLIHYPVPIHLQGCYEQLGYKRGDFPNTERIAQKIVSIPIYSELSEEEVAYIIKTINAFEI